MISSPKQNKTLNRHIEFGTDDEGRIVTIRIYTNTYDDAEKIANFVIECAYNK